MTKHNVFRFWVFGIILFGITLSANLSIANENYYWESLYHIGDSTQWRGGVYDLYGESWSANFILDSIPTTCTLTVDAYEVYDDDSSDIYLNGQRIGSLSKSDTDDDWEITMIDIPSTYFLVGENEIRIASAIVSNSNVDDFLIRDIRFFFRNTSSDKSYQTGYDQGYIDGQATCEGEANCIQVITYAKVPDADCWVTFSTPCDVPEGWETTNEKPSSMCTSCDSQLPVTGDSCATFDIFTNTLHVPCFNAGTSTYWLDWELTGSEPVSLELKDIGSN